MVTVWVNGTTDVPINGCACHQQRLDTQERTPCAVPEHWSEDNVCSLSGRQAIIATYDAIVRCYKGFDIDSKVLEASQSSGIQIEQISP